MKFPIKKTIFLLSIALVSCAIYFSYTYFTNALNRFVVKTLEKSIHAQVSVGKIKLAFPLHLELKDIKINNAINIKGINIYLSPGSFLIKNRLAISHIRVIEPFVKIERGNHVFDDFYSKAQTLSPGSPKLLPYFSRITIEDGTLIYDAGDAMQVECIHIHGTLETTSLYFAKDKPYIFEARGFLKNQNSDFLASFQIQGWAAQDRSLKLKLKADKINLESLGPIYVKYLKGIVSEGRVDFFSDVSILDNNLTAECSLTSRDLVFTKADIFKLKEPLQLNFMLFVDLDKHSVKISNLHGNLLTAMVNTP